MLLSAKPGEEIRANRGDFTAHYGGEALFWWRDPEAGTPNLLQGRSGVAVAALKARLRELGHLGADATSNMYDASTARAIARLQAKAGLGVDGIAGKQVRMVLSSWRADSDAPKLWETAEADETATDGTEVIAAASPEPKPLSPATPLKPVEAHPAAKAVPAEETPEPAPPAEDEADVAPGGGTPDAGELEIEELPEPEPKTARDAALDTAPANG